MKRKIKSAFSGKVTRHEKTVGLKMQRREGVHNAIVDTDVKVDGRRLSLLLTAGKLRISGFPKDDRKRGSMVEVDLDAVVFAALELIDEDEAAPKAKPAAKPKHGFKVGDGATSHCGSDSYPCTVIEVVGARVLVVRRDKVRRVDKNGQCGPQQYLFTSDPDGDVYRISLREDGVWREVGKYKGRRFTVGKREHYLDPSF